MKPLDIKWRVLFVALMPALLICTTLSLYFIALRYQEVELSLNARGSSLARQLASAAEYGAFSGNRTELLRLAETAAREQDVVAVSFYGRNGDVLVRIESPGTVSGISPQAGQPSQEALPGLSFREGIFHRASAFDDPFQMGASSSRTNELLGSVLVETSRDRADREKKDILGVTLLFSFAALVIGILFSYRLGRDVTEPILALQKTVSRIHLGDLQARVEHHPGGTLRTLEEGVNEMAASLETNRNHLEHCISEATQELRIQKDEAERTSLAKSRFLAAASHDLRQPLHALTLFADELDPKAGEPPQGHLIEQIRSAITVLNEQLSTLLDISRIDLGDIRLSVEVVDLQAIIERVIALHTPDALAKELRLRNVPTQFRVRTDPKLLERMLGNLLSNAIRYTEYGGILIGARRRGDRVFLEVWDTGMGIGHEQIPLIFQEFYQIRNPERDAQKGLGLGLSIVTRLAHMLDHPVRVRSNPGRGSVFSISLPGTDEMPAVQAGNASGHGIVELASKRHTQFDFDADILLLGTADDEQALLAHLLNGWGCRALCVERIEAYEALLHQGAPLVDAVIFSKDREEEAMRFAGKNAWSDAQPIRLIQLADADTPAMPISASPLAAEPGNTRPVRINRPIRPARLRALLQQVLSATE